MKKMSLKKCPLCGAQLNGEERENVLINEMNELKEKGILQPTMFVAVKIIQSMSEKNPVWLKEALNKQTNMVNESIGRKLAEESRLVLKSIMEIKGNPTIIGMRARAR